MLPLRTFHREFSHSASVQQTIKNVTVIGSGLMGAGIAQIAAQTGHNVVMMDADGAALKKGEERIEESIERVAKKKYGDDKGAAAAFIKDSLARIATSTSVADSVKSADIVVEAIVENLQIKQKLFAQLEKDAPEHAILASNTSSLPISKICEQVQRKDRCGGLHFFNPVPVMKLLEVITIPETSDECYESMTNWGKAIGKVTVKCRDTQGFIVNRLLIPYSLEASRMYDRGWNELYPDNPLFAMPETLKRLVAEGKFGRKTGEGHYSYK